MAPNPRKRQPLPVGNPLHEVIADRLYTCPGEELIVDYLAGVTVVINLSGEADLVPDPGRYLCVTWATSDNVDEGQFEGVVRFCSSVMKSRAQRVMITGHQDTVDTVATCVLREFVGCDAQTALGVMRSQKPNCMTKSELVETVFKYKVS